MKKTDWNISTIPYLLHKRASESAHDVAYSFPGIGQHCTWQMIWEEARLLAKGFLQLGVKKGDAIAILMPGRAEMIAAMFAAACVGAVIVPINTYSKKQELAHYLRDAKPVILITGVEAQQNHFPSIVQEIIQDSREEADAGKWLPKHIFVLDERPQEGTGFLLYSDLKTYGSAMEETAFEAACRSTSPQDPLILLYTSGTLGLPKGVLRSTASFLISSDQTNDTGKTNSLLVSLSDKITRYFAVMNLLPLYHLGGFATLFTSLKSCNIRIVMLSHFNPLHALAAVEKEKCRVLIGTPYMVQQMLLSPRREEFNLKSLLGIAFTSAAVNNTMLQKIMKGMSLYFFMVSYGSSEAGSVANGTCFVNRRNNVVLLLLYKLLSHTNLLSGLINYKEFEKGAYSIGGKVDKLVEVRILNPDTGEAMPPHEHGEIAIRSHRVMRYTNEAYDKASMTEDGWYKSGDLGFLDHQRHLTITGRLHRMISRGGEKISPVEIENVLLRHEDIDEALVIGVPDELYGEQVCACVVARQGAGLTSDKLKKDMTPYLSAFKLPRYIVFLPDFPLSPTGKISIAEIKSMVLNGKGELRRHA
ncbi:fatty-acyl-CoA synthase [Paenibacillus endophyticus]|uniref:Fatty-acyl-CoA synthase n=1 Tax=Paenibacillus endophyticus TaxID=1294268 RepID=A0A7W5CFI6_9BACL|nr:class I adenylate-forming enzyme family protein [Paenibacillus endophyticus]MBB3156269.1 fatty-acyl-CoA synthase [Paenibacillus endophyticus]